MQQTSPVNVSEARSKVSIPVRLYTEMLAVPQYNINDDTKYLHVKLRHV